MKTKFRFLVLIIALIVSQLSFADTVENENSKAKGAAIAGRVVDTQNLPLPGATILIKSLNVGVISDADGFYRINRLKTGSYEIEVSYIGFQNFVETVAVKIGEVTPKDFILEAGLEINEVVVNGGLQGQSKALNQQRNSVNVTNVISSDQVGRFPDQNVGDALKRIPGVNVQYDQGEARFGHVRGLAPEYNSVTIDGDRIPSAEAETRSVQLDLIPSDMVQSIEVSKVVTPEMDGDAIGGSINLVTKSNPYKQRIAGSVGTTYNALTGKPAANFALMYGNRAFNNKLGYTVAASVQDHKLGSDDIEAEWDEDGKMTDFQVRTYLLQRLRQSYSASLDYEFNPNHKIDLKVMYNHRNDWENRYRLRYKKLDKEGAAKIERELKAGSSDNKNARLEDQRTLHIALGGEHQFGALEMDWKGSYAKASETRPHERYLTYVMKGADITQDLTNTRKPKVIVNTADAQDLNANWKFDELTEEYQYTDDIDKNFKIDFKLPVLEGSNESSLKFGVKYKGKSKQRDNDFYDVTPANEDQFNADAMNNLIDVTKDNYLPGNYVAGTFVDRKYLGSLDLESSDYKRDQNLEELAGNFNASEEITAAYLRYDQKVSKLDIVAGLRFENTSIKYQGKALTLNADGDVESLNDTEEASSSYNNFLPSLLLKYNFSKDSKLKLAYSNTIARPKYIGLVPRVEISQEDNEISIGNPDLIPTTSMNIDLMYENYFQSIGIFSAGVFYKNMKNFIAEVAQNDYVYNNNTWDKFTQYVNAGNANIMGFEVALQRQFDFLPGFLKQTGFYTNYTFTNSTVTESNVEDRNADELSLPGTPTHNFNASLYYEGEKLSTRASFNFASDFIDEFGGAAFEDRYYDKVTYLDVNASYQFGTNFIGYVEANNLLNQPLSYYQGAPEFVMQDEYYNVRINLGVKFNF